MGGFFGVASKTDAVFDTFFGTDYHSHLGTRRAGMAAYDDGIGLQREIHSIENSLFRTKFEDSLHKMKGRAAIGCISDYYPQPLLVRSSIGAFALCYIGIINNKDTLINDYLKMPGTHFEAMTGGKVNETELIASLITEKDDIVEGIRHAQDLIDGTASILIVRDDGTLIAARDKFGRLPIVVGKKEGAMCVTFESFAYHKLGYEDYGELGPGEIVELTADEYIQLSPPRKEMRICAFLWSYYGYPTSTYEGRNVEVMRYKNGEIMAKTDKKLKNADNIDYVGGVPDSGTPHAIGYSNESHIPFARAFIKYTPTWSRSFMPTNQSDRNVIANMKQIPVKELIQDKNLLFVDDSIVRGTQMRETVEFLYENGAKEVHMRSACPPLLYPCKYLNFSRANSDMELITRQVIVELEGQEGLKHLDEYADHKSERGQKMRKRIGEKLHLASLEFQTLEGIEEAIGIDPCKLCTYCWSGKE